VRGRLRDQAKPGGGTLLYSTFLGGSNDDTITDISLNNAGMAFVTGFTNSTDFPTTASAFKKSIPAGVGQLICSRLLQPDGKSLNYSTLLGGSHSTKAGSIVVDPAWNAWVAAILQTRIILLLPSLSARDERRI